MAQAGSSAPPAPTPGRPVKLSAGAPAKGKEAGRREPQPAPSPRASYREGAGSAGGVSSRSKGKQVMMMCLVIAKPR